MMKIISLFSGCGGLDLGFERAGFNIAIQTPVLFNDPFDCNIGMSVNQLIRALMPDFFDKILPDTNADVRDALSSWMFGGNAPELEEGSAEHLLSICSSSPTIVKILDKARSGQDVSDQEMLSLVVEDPITFSEMINLCLCGNKG